MTTPTTMTAGPAPEKAAATLIMVHGRGASAESILSLYDELALPTLAAVAPEAPNGTWYPHSFLAPIASNQPHLDNALATLASVVNDLKSRGIPNQKIALLGFSQGACLVSEFVARNPEKFGAVLVLTGGVIGPDASARKFEGSLQGTPIFIGTSNPDPHVPLSRVRETESIFKALGAKVDVQIYTGMPHSINDDELGKCRAILNALTGSIAQES